MKERILKAFWHRGRKAFVPWTTQELATRAKLPHDKISVAMGSLVLSGLAVSQKTHMAGFQTWHLTEAGKVAASNIITAEAFANGGAA